MAEFEAEEGREFAKPICFTGNISSELLGLDDFALDWFTENCRAVLHNAASIRFHAPNHDRTKDPWLSNFTGTKNLLEVCKLAGIEEFHHVSTAYVTGKRTDTCYERELDEGQEYVNDYQHSKVEAEKLIRGSDFLTSKTIYRPGLVVGDSRTGFTTAPDFGLYHYILFNNQVTRQMREAGETGTLHLPFRLRFTGKERRNIVTVDWVSDAIVYLVTHPEYHNETYHLTPSKPCSSSEIIESLKDYFDYTGVEFIGPTEIPEEDQTPVEKLFYDYVETFESYWEDEPVFDRTNTDRVLNEVLPTPVVDGPCLKRLIGFAVEHCFSRATCSIPCTKRSTQTSFFVPLRTTVMRTPPAPHKTRNPPNIHVTDGSGTTTTAPLPNLFACQMAKSSPLTTPLASKSAFDQPASDWNLYLFQMMKSWPSTNPSKLASPAR